MSAASDPKGEVEERLPTNVDLGVDDLIDAIDADIRSQIERNDRQPVLPV